MSGPGRGRGSFLALKPTVAGVASGESFSSEEVSVKDSGLGSRSPVSLGEFRRVGRGKLLDDLASSCSSMSLNAGTGRARLFESLKSGDSGEQIQEQRPQGRGRAQILKSLLPEPVADDHEPQGVKTNGAAKSDAAQPVDERGAVALNTFYKPTNTRGNIGTPFKIACNYIRLCSDPKKGVFVYEVRFNPNVDSMGLRMKYLNEHRDKFGGTKTFDGVTLYLPILLSDKLTTYVSKNVVDNSNVEIRILYKKKESLKDCMHLYNVLFDRVMKTLNYVRFDRKQFDPKSPKVIPQAKLEVWPGYVTAVDEYEGGLMLCCDVSHRVLCDKTALEALTEIFHKSNNNFQENAKKALLGAVVITRYNNRTYRIDDILFDKNPLSTFKTKDSEISYVDYYRKNHNIVIKDLRQPLLISIKKQRGSEQKVAEDFVFCLIPEVCFLTGLQDNIRSDYKLMREIATVTRVTPNQRMQALEKFYKNINECAEAREILQSWGLSLKPSCEYMTGRRLDEVQVFFGGNKAFSAGKNADFSKYAGSSELLEVIHLRNWVVFHCRSDARAANTFCDHMGRNAAPLGVQIQRPKMVVLDNDRVDTYVQALRNNIKNDTQVIVCICPTSRDDRYAAIKKVCCSEIPVPSQVINARTLSNDAKNRSIVQKIALQINCKLGGTLWSVKIGIKDVMVCGIDSYHDAAQKGNSVAAFVASLNSNYTKWYSKAVIQTRREEIVNGLCSSFTAALIAYEKSNGKLPESVTIFRDGVGDGQLNLVSQYEIPQFEDAAKRMFPNYNLKITFVVVQKRINTRYFEMKGSMADNPLPGSIVDENITRKSLYDFFLVSQSVRQGTVSPSHYIVLKDDMKRSPDTIQRLTYKLCFLYYNWPGTIRIPACCQYAHKMAYLIGQSIRRSTSEELATKLFYL